MRGAAGKEGKDEAHVNAALGLKEGPGMRGTAWGPWHHRRGEAKQQALGGLYSVRME